MFDTPLLVSLLIFISINLILFGAFFHYHYHKRHTQLLARIGKQEGKMTAFKQHLLETLSSLGQFLKPRQREKISELRKTFLKAGCRHFNAPFIYFGVKGFLAGSLVFSFSLLKPFVFKAMPPPQILFWGVFLAVAGFYLPGIWLRAKIAGRKEEILKGFPDALDLLVVCVKAGMSLDAAISRVGEEITLSNKPLSEEFHLLNMELQAGKARSDALKSMASRIDLEEIDILTALLVQTDKFGTSVAKALLVHSDTMRIGRRQRAEEAAAKLPVKIMFPLIFFIFPAIFVVLLGPAAIRFLETF